MSMRLFLKRNVCGKKNNDIISGGFRFCCVGGEEGAPIISRGLLEFQGSAKFTNLVN